MPITSQTRSAVGGSGYSGYSGTPIDINVLSLTDGASQLITANQCKNFIIHNGDCTQTIEVDLPAASVGMRITVYVIALYTIKIDPNLNDQIMVLTSAPGDYLLSDAVRGTSISLVCLQANKWEPVGVIGAWTEE
jgi:hypothetical protein